MKPIDFKKTEKDLYQPKSTPSIIDVKEIIVIAIDGKGDPNTGAEYAASIETLYGLSYAIKMGNKAILEYVVPPLEGLWQGNDVSITEAIFETAKKKLAKKKPSLDLTKARLEKIAEGLCVQVMHIGSYDNEPATIAAMEKYAIESGYAIDISEARRHHEIYLSDPRKVEPEKLKTIIRHPIIKK
ncbi:hypothetical protein AGMMS50239_02980 [Bacteroidia bacterium]|nr:hypothetical protein AGMMS50239_02980 [Bacteroidia bacterium]